MVNNHVSATKPANRQKKAVYFLQRHTHTNLSGFGTSVRGSHSLTHAKLIKKKKERQTQKMANALKTCGKNGEEIYVTTTHGSLIF